jgi:hypothetical protein
MSGYLHTSESNLKPAVVVYHWQFALVYDLLAYILIGTNDMKADPNGR